MNIRALGLTAALFLSASAGASAWVGGNVTTGGYGVHIGTSLLRVPFIGTLGLEGSAEKGWNSADPNRFAAGVTLRDLNLPLTRVDAFATAGVEYRNAAHLYGEAGLRGPLLGPAGWRAFVRGNSAAQFGAGVGLELRF
ncbi:hypothetical protein Dxin01_00645 [Deinococcus xinjiangensis]|uniref:Outer membrane protein beta-barrel domain-containing protein n=1 Tax=Deinococcus xinjiangensis TaxID=457454 RepID=A0ABP9VB48_9DEIO